MSNDARPEIRFPGFTDDWKQRKLGDETKILAGGDVDKTKLKENGKYPVLANALTNDGIVGYYDDDFRIKAPAVTVTGRGDVGYAQARRVNFTPVVRLLSVKSKHDVDFLENSINNHKVLVESTGVPQLTAPQLGNYKIFFPTIEEETKIGSLFKKLDTAINIHQRELDLLKETKKGFLQKMFPKNGAKVPEIRFPGFTEDWEERKLGELGKTQSGIGFPDAEQGGSEGIPFFKVSDMNNIGNEYEMRNANHYVSNEQIERKKWKPIKDVPAIIFAKVGAAIMLNRKRLVTSPFLIDNNTMAYLFNNTWDIYFGKILFETINLPRYSQVGALPSYNSSDIENISVKVPVKDEQQKIGTFFKQLDDTIALHQRKLDLLKETKKGFLQKMFV